MDGIYFYEEKSNEFCHLTRTLYSDEIDSANVEMGTRICIAMHNIQP